MTMRDLCFDEEECSQLLSGLNDPPGTLNSQPKPKLNELSNQWTCLQVHVSWFVSKILTGFMNIQEKEVRYFLVSVYGGRLQLQVWISLAVQPVQGPQLTHPPLLLLLLHRICKIWWAFQITTGTLTSAGNPPPKLLCGSVAIGDPSCEIFPVCAVRWQLEGAALGCLQQWLPLRPGKAVPPHPLSSSIQCPALLRCPTPRPRIWAQPRAVHCFTSSPPVILRFTAAQDELQTSHWAMCTSPWKPSDPVRTENVLGLFPK